MAFSRVAIVGAGVMGEAMITALERIGISSAAITIKEKRADREAELFAKFGAKSGLISDSDVVLLAVKPQDVEKTLSEIKKELKDGTLIVSLLAGVKSSKIQEMVGSSARVVRVMPNTPLLMGVGMSAITAGKSATKSDVEWVESLLSSSGATVLVDESQMDAVTATSGSGPAYFFGFVEAMVEGARKLGLDESSAKLLVSQTLLGAAKMVNESGKDAKTLRENVTSPNGTTAAALSVFDSSKWHEIVYEAMKAARDRSQELSN
ncbi:MAG: pyrroline-5-carboxylate reductase [Candidatus Nanopelagicaceae bacterium]|nr:pyrroline-5-carboxylate reductase [Candidatus Nanopelagicaceae bacterium]